jgi:hypothetical protein
MDDDTTPFSSRRHGLAGEHLSFGVGKYVEVVVIYVKNDIIWDRVKAPLGGGISGCCAKKAPHIAPPVQEDRSWTGQL